MGEVDDLIRELALSRRVPDGAESIQIVEHVVSAEFFSDGSLTRHLNQRIADEQWVPSTTESVLLADFGSLIATAHLLGVYQRRGGTIASFVSATSPAVPAFRLGVRAFPQSIVVYSADRSKIVTGYQFSAFSELSVPEDVQWHRLTPLQ